MTAETEKSIKIVVIEDEILYNDIISKALVQEGDIQVLGNYTSAQQASQEIPQLQPDVALIDIELGSEINGIDLALELRDKLSDLGIVLLSNHIKVSFANILAREKLKGWAYLLKKSLEDIATLHRAIFSVMQGEIVLDEKLVEKLSNSDSTNILTPRQREILGLVSQGHINMVIAEKLNLSRRSVENQLNEIYDKLAIKNKNINPRVKAVLMYLENQA